MISVLVVAPPREDLAKLVSRHPSVEILRARDLEETLEKLGRNRRIDAVLLLIEETERIVAAIQEENPAPPPLFLPRTVLDPPAGTRTLPAEELGELLDLVVQAIQSRG